MINVLDYAPGTTLMHRLNPVTKLALAASLIAALFLTESVPTLGVQIVAILALGCYARVGRRLASMLKLLVPIAAVMFALQVAFVRSGAAIGPLATTDGFITGSRACLRLVGVALPLVLVLACTRLTDLANACVEVLHLPYRYAFTFTTALRFVPLFTQEMNAIMEAQAARGVAFDTANPLRKLRLMLPLCIPLLVTSVSKTDAAALAAEQRGFYLRGRNNSYKRYPLTRIDVAALAVCIALLAAGIAL